MPSPVEAHVTAKENLVQRDKYRDVGRILRRKLPMLVVVAGAASLFGVQAGAAAATLTPGHAYCYYFSTPRYGGMHLVAASPTVIAAGPSNYISGLSGKPQDTVFYIDCAGRIGGDAYVGLPRIVMQRSATGYAFDRNFVIPGIRHLGTTSRTTLTASISISGTVVVGAINGTVHVKLPSCLARTLVVHYSGH